MTASTLSSRSVLEVLTRDRLVALGREFGVSIAQRAKKDDQIRSLVDSGELRLLFEPEDRFQKEQFEKDLEYMEGRLGHIDRELEAEPKAPAPLTNLSNVIGSTVLCWGTGSCRRRINLV